MGDARDFDSERLQKPGQVNRRGLALDRRVGRENHFLDNAGFHSPHEFLDLQLVRTATVERRDRAVQDVVSSAKPVAAFDGEACIGAVAYTPMLNWILTIVVEPSYRRQGVGRALMQGLVESLPEGIEAVRLQNVDGEDSGMASFLERVGFEPLVDQYEMTRKV